MLIRLCKADSVRLVGLYLIKILLILIFVSPPLYPASKQLLSSTTQKDLFSVSFPTKDIGWACGRWGTILNSSDGGQSWTPQKSNTDNSLSDIFFADTKMGWAVGDAGTILHTRDGGATWVKQKCPVSHTLMGMCFVNSQVGWIVGERTTILHTENGGHKWQIQFQNEDYILKKVSFCDADNGWAVGEYGYTYHTVNGGKKWQHQAGEFRYLENTGELIAGDYLFDVIAVDPQTAWVAGIDGYIAKTLDGGDTWIRVTNGVPKTHLFTISSDKHGGLLIGGVATLKRTVSGWGSLVETTMKPAITYGWIYKIAKRGGEGFVAVGKDGWIYLSDASGASWTRVSY